jgi:ribonuclease J
MSIREPEFDGIIVSGQAKNYVSRDLACQSKMPDALVEFVHQRPEDPLKKPSKNKAKERACNLTPGKICCSEELKLPFEVKSFKMDHSIYGALAYVLESKNGSIAYTGDFRVSKNGESELGSFTKKARDTSTLIIEGTRAGREGDNAVDEEYVKENCLKAAEETKGIVVADYSSKNFERMRTFLEIARKTGRQLVITMKDAYALHAIRCADGPAILDNLLIYSEIKEMTKVWERYLNGRESLNYIAAKDVSSNPDGYILSFSFFDLNDLMDIRPNAGSYIYSSSEAYTEEQAIDFGKLKNWLDVMGLKPVGFNVQVEDGKVRPYFESGYHASGHASKEEIAKIIDDIDPDVIIPVHTTKSEWFEEHFGGSHSVKLLRNGEKFVLN